MWVLFLVPEILLKIASALLLCSVFGEHRKFASKKICLYSVSDCLTIQDGILTLWIKISIIMNLSSKAVLLAYAVILKGFSKFNRTRAKLNPLVQKYVFEIQKQVVLSLE